MVKGTKQVTDNLSRWAENRIRGIADFDVFTASQVQTNARTNAIWNNITGDARKGLTGLATVKLPMMFISLFHKMIYGKWLELANDGKFGILEKTLNEKRAEWFKGIRRLMTKGTKI